MGAHEAHLQEERQHLQEQLLKTVETSTIPKVSFKKEQANVPKLPKEQVELPVKETLTVSETPRAEIDPKQLVEGRSNRFGSVSTMDSGESSQYERSYSASEMSEILPPFVSIPQANFIPKVEIVDMGYQKEELDQHVPHYESKQSHENLERKKFFYENPSAICFSWMRSCEDAQEIPRGGSSGSAMQGSYGSVEVSLDQLIHESKEIYAQKNLWSFGVNDETPSVALVFGDEFVRKLILQVLRSITKLHYTRVHGSLSPHLIHVSFQPGKEIETLQVTLKSDDSIYFVQDKDLKDEAAQHHPTPASITGSSKVDALLHRLYTVFREGDPRKLDDHDTGRAHTEAGHLTHYKGRKGVGAYTPNHDAQMILHNYHYMFSLAERTQLNYQGKAVMDMLTRLLRVAPYTAPEMTAWRIRQIMVVGNPKKQDPPLSMMLDCWSVGAIIYELYTGRPLMDGSTYKNDFWHPDIASFKTSDATEFERKALTLFAIYNEANYNFNHLIEFLAAKVGKMDVNLESDRFTEQLSIELLGKNTPQSAAAVLSRMLVKSQSHRLVHISQAFFSHYLISFEKCDGDSRKAADKVVELGQGNFGKVCRAKLYERWTVAVKVIRRPKLPIEILKRKYNVPSDALITKDDVIFQDRRRHAEENPFALFAPEHDISTLAPTYQKRVVEEMHNSIVDEEDFIRERENLKLARKNERDHLAAVRFHRRRAMPHHDAMEVDSGMGGNATLAASFTSSRNASSDFLESNNGDEALSLSVSLWDSFEDKDSFYLVMSLVEDSMEFEKYMWSQAVPAYSNKKSLSDTEMRHIQIIVGKRPPISGEPKSPCFPMHKIRRYFAQMATGLLRYSVNPKGELRDEILVHRDVKLENMLISKQTDTVIQIDLGLSARQKGADSTITGPVGTPYYVSPEIVSGKRYNYATDVWSLGVTLFRMITMEFPFQGEDASSVYRRVLHFPPNWGSPAMVGHVPRDVKDLVHQMLDKNFEDRITLSQIMLHPFVTALPEEEYLKLGLPKNIEDEYLAIKHGGPRQSDQFASDRVSI